MPACFGGQMETQSVVLQPDAAKQCHRAGSAIVRNLEHLEDDLRILVFWFLDDSSGSSPGARASRSRWGASRAPLLRGFLPGDQREAEMCLAGRQTPRPGRSRSRILTVFGADSTDNVEVLVSQSRRNERASRANPAKRLTINGESRPVNAVGWKCLGR